MFKGSPFYKGYVDHSYRVQRRRRSGAGRLALQPRPSRALAGHSPVIRRSFRRSSTLQAWRSDYKVAASIS